MNSSISSSDRCFPDKPWFSILILSIVLTGLILGWWEFLWRHLGHTPAVIDDKDLWCTLREDLEKNGSKSIVLLGASRMRISISPTVFREAFLGYDVFQLSVDGSSFMPVLQDLADDPSFTGIVICSLFESKSLNNHGKQQDYVRYFHSDWNVAMRLDRTLRTLVQKKLVMLKPDLSIRAILKCINQKKLPQLSYLHNLADRSCKADFNLLDAEKKDYNKNYLARVVRGEKLVSPQSEAFRNVLAATTRTVATIEKRGGQVVIVRLTSSDQLWEAEKHTYPRNYYWEQYRSMVNGKAIHFADVPAMRCFRCPDGSHLDHRDVPAYTRILIHELRKVVRE